MSRIRSVCTLVFRSTLFFEESINGFGLIKKDKRVEEKMDTKEKYLLVFQSFLGQILPLPGSFFTSQGQLILVEGLLLAPGTFI